MDRLIKEKGGKYFAKEIVIEENPKRLKGLLNPLRWKILQSLSEKPSYSYQIAKDLNIDEQSVYYHMHQLEKNKLIKVIKKETLGGALAKYYSPTQRAFAFELSGGDEKILENPLIKQNNKLKDFLFPFIYSGKLNAKIVVGSPDPHGKFQVRARDSHYSIDLALFLGQFVELPEAFSVRLDIDIIAENQYNNNLIVVGGILTNTITDKINNYLPVKFQSEKFPFRGIVSKKTGKKYLEDSHAIIAKIPNPKFLDKSILLLAGNRFNGTKAAIIALTRNYKNLLKDYNHQDTWVKVIQGIDLKGDGKISDIKILE